MIYDLVKEFLGFEILAKTKVVQKSVSQGCKQAIECEIKVKIKFKNKQTIGHISFDENFASF